MLVKAKWNIKDASGWHTAGEIFQTNDDLGNAVEVLDAPKKAIPETPVKKEAKQEEAEKPAAEETKAEKPRTATRRKKSAT